MEESAIRRLAAKKDIERKVDEEVALHLRVV